MLYIAYGANTNHDNMADRCPDAKYVGRTTLHGFRLMFRGVADIVQDHTDCVEVALWDISMKDERALDRFEGFPTLYQKKTVAVPCGGRTVAAMVYYMVKDRGFAPPSDYYYNCLQQGYYDCGINQSQLDDADSKSGYIFKNKLEGIWQLDAIR